MLITSYEKYTKPIGKKNPKTQNRILIGFRNHVDDPFILKQLGNKTVFLYFDNNKIRISFDGGRKNVLPNRIN